MATATLARRDLAGGAAVPGAVRSPVADFGDAPLPGGRSGLPSRIRGAKTGTVR